MITRSQRQRVPWDATAPPLLNYEDIIYTQSTAGRYAWNPIAKTLHGPFGSGELAGFTLDGREYGQFCSAYTETCGKSETFSAWTTIGGASVASDQVASPDSDKQADKLTFGAAAADGIKIQLGSATDDTDQTQAVFVRSVSGTKDFRLGFLRKDNTESLSGDFTATTDWQRFDITADILAGGTTPEARIINDSGGNAGDIYIFGANVHKDKSWPYPYLGNDTGGDVDCTKDDGYFDAVDVPAALRTKKHVIWWVPNAASTDTRGAQYIYHLYDSGANKSVRVVWNANDTMEVTAFDGGWTRRAITGALTVARGSLNQIILDPVEGSIELPDTTGGTKNIDTPWSALMPATSILYYGGFFTGGDQLNGLLSLPVEVPTPP